MPRTPFAAAALAALLMSAPNLAPAADQDGHFAVKDAGAQTCGALLKSWEEKNRDLGQYAGWIAGYVTGVNQLTNGLYDLAAWQSTETLLGMTRSICQQAPAETRFLDAFAALVQRISPVRLQRKSDLEGVRRDGKAIVIYKAILAEARIRLAREGFPSGDPNAPFDQRASDAFLAYQKAFELDETGLPDQKTLFSLFMGRDGEGGAGDGN
ncbi:MAG: peptidoglycan-binding domain-containing protein [Pseudomonadota bacterium]